MSAAGMPPHLSALFQPRPPLLFIKRPTVNRQTQGTGLAGLLQSGVFETTPPPELEPFQTPKQLLSIKKEIAIDAHSIKQKDDAKAYDPDTVANPTKDPYRTLFVGNLSYTSTEKKLKKELERFGRIKRIRMVTDQEEKPRGYAFVEFEDERSMKDAYKNADRMKIDNFRILVDVERGRTVSGWLPRRLGGGKGSGRPALEPRAVILERRRNEEIARRAALAAQAPAFGRGRGRGGGRGGYRGGGGGGYGDRGGDRFGGGGGGYRGGGGGGYRGGGGGGYSGGGGYRGGGGGGGGDRDGPRGGYGDRDGGGSGGGSGGDSGRFGYTQIVNRGNTGY